MVGLVAVADMAGISARLASIVAYVLGICAADVGDPERYESLTYEARSTASVSTTPTPRSGEKIVLVSWNM
jgi:hypothetical protein